MTDLFLGFYLGVFSIILFFNLLWYLYNKEIAYLYYFFLHVGIVLITLNAYNIIEIKIIFVSIPTILLIFLFTKEFLNLDKYYKKGSKIFLYSGVIFTLLLLVLYLTDNTQIVKNFPFSLLILLLVVVAYNVYKKGFKLAKYFIFAWGVNFVIFLLSDINRILDFDNTNITYLGQLGNIIEPIILSFALFAKTRNYLIEKNEKEKMLIHQSRLASMGSMLANISHQWRQPLNRIAFFIMNMQLHIMDKKNDPNFLNKKLDESQTQLEYMSSTLDDFTNFYKKDKLKEEFYISESLSNATNIILPSFKSKEIDFNISINEDFTLNSYPKELAQVFLNLLQNANDAIVINNIENPKIDIIVNKNEIIIKDNAKGIDEDILYKIFEPYFTTKENYKGTGLGLYMSRMILETNFNAEISVENIDEGTEFRIYFY